MRLWIVCVFVLSGCGSSYFPKDSYSSGPPPSVWMLKNFGIGKQCTQGDWDAEFEVEKARIQAQLSVIGIEPYNELVDKGPTCRDCGCSVYNGMYFIQIDAAQETEDLVKELGFQLSSPPSVDRYGNKRY